MIAGVEAATEAADAYLFVLGDQPLLTPGNRERGDIPV